jgi:hypothetical protein
MLVESNELDAEQVSASDADAALRSLAQSQALLERGTEWDPAPTDLGNELALAAPDVAVLFG